MNTKKKPATPTDVSELLTIAEAAQVADVTEQWLRTLVQTGRVEGVRLGPLWFVKKSSVATFERHPTRGRPRTAKKSAGSPRRR